MQHPKKGLQKDPFDLYDEDEGDVPEHLSQWNESTDLTKPIFMLADDDDLDGDDPFKEDDPALSAMLSGTMDWTTEGHFSLDPDAEPTLDPFIESPKPAAKRSEGKEDKDTATDDAQEGNAKLEASTDRFDMEEKEPSSDDSKGKEKELEGKDDEGGIDDNEVVLEDFDEVLESLEESSQPTEPIPEKNDLKKEEAEARFRGELMRQSVDMGKLRHLCKTYSVPDALRGDIWKHLLGAEKQPSNPMNGWMPTTDKPEYAELEDACRNTRPEHPFFHEPETIELMKRVLIFYCERRTIPYKTGFNELLAPFLLLSLPEGVVFNCFYAFLAKFLPVLFTTDETVEPCIYELFRLLVLYHDPELCSHLDQNNLRPQQLVDTWFSTFFATLCNIDVLMVLWDFLFVSGDPFMHFFIALALISSKRDVILPLQDRDHILIILAKMRLSSTAEAEHLIKKAQYYESTMPKSFRQQVFATTYHTNEFNTWIRRYLYARSAFSVPTCLQVSVAEVVHAATTSEAGVKFFVFDCRPLEQYMSGRLPTAYHLPPRMLLEKPEEFKKLLSGFEPLKGNHFCFFGAGQMETETYLQLIVLQFLQKGFQHVSIVHGGYEALHTLLQTRNTKGIELADHDPKACLLCINQASQPQTPAEGDSAAPSKGTPTQARRSSDGGSRKFSISLPKVDAKLPQLGPGFSKAPVPSSLITSLGSSLASSISMVREKSTSITSNITSSLSSANASSDVLPSLINVLSKDEKRKPSTKGRSPRGGAEDDKGPVPLFTIDDDDEEDDRIGDEIEMESGDNGRSEEVEQSDEQKDKEQEQTDGQQQKPEESNSNPKEKEKENNEQKKEAAPGLLPSLSRSFLFWGGGNTAAPKENTSAATGISEEELHREKERELAFKRENEKERERQLERQRSLDRERSNSQPESPRLDNEGTATTSTTTTTTPTTSESAPASAGSSSPAPQRRAGLWSWWTGGAAAAELEDEQTVVAALPVNEVDNYSAPSDTFFSFDSYVESHPSWLFFSCKKLFAEEEPRPWYLVVTPTELLELRVHPSQGLMVAVDSSHSLKDVTTITFKKSNPNLLTFVFGEEREQYLVNTPGDCVKAVKRAIEKYMQEDLNE